MKLESLRGGGDHPAHTKKIPQRGSVVQQADHHEPDRTAYNPEPPKADDWIDFMQNNFGLALFGGGALLSSAVTLATGSMGAGIVVPAVLQFLGPYSTGELTPLTLPPTVLYAHMTLAYGLTGAIGATALGAAVGLALDRWA